MSAFANLAGNVAGAWLVMRGRADGLARLDLSVEGFWRSFAAIVPIAPFALLALVSQSMLPAQEGTGPAAAPGAGDLAQEMLVLLVDWTAFPLVFALLAKPLGLGSRYVPFIVTRNWSTLVVSAMVSVVHAGHIVGLLPPQVASVLLLVAVAVALRFSYTVARIALDVSPMLALPVTIFDFLLSLTIWSALA